MTLLPIVCKRSMVSNGVSNKSMSKMPTDIVFADLETRASQRQGCPENGENCTDRVSTFFRFFGGCYFLTFPSIFIQENRLAIPNADEPTFRLVHSGPTITHDGAGLHCSFPYWIPVPFKLQYELNDSILFIRDLRVNYWIIYHTNKKNLYRTRSHILIVCDYVCT